MSIGQNGSAEFFSLKRCLVIAEVAQTHDGSLGQAHAFIDAVAETGADGIKFQTHIADAESTPDEPFRTNFSKQDKNRYDYWKRMEFTEQQWQGLAQHATAKGLYFLSSAFSIDAVRLLDRIGVPAWKVGSGEIANFPMLKLMAETRKPILLSSGMSPWQEIDKTYKFLKNLDAKVAILQCTSMYPTPPEHVGLNNITELQKRFDVPVGLSDHSATIFPSLAAVVLGAKFLEVHVTLSKFMFGPDVSSSLTPEQLKELVKGVRFLETALTHPVNKDELANNLATIRTLFTRSVVPTTDLAKGTVLRPEHLTLKKPAKGLSSDLLPELYGRRVKRALKKDEFFSLKDLEDV